MNCHQFNSHLTELARREPLDAALKHACEAHRAACAPCRQRLADFESLQQALAALAHADAAAAAPLAVEQRLREAFRQQAASHGSVRQPGHRRPLVATHWPRSWWWLTGAAAALVVVVATFGLRRAAIDQQPLTVAVTPTLAEPAVTPSSVMPELSVVKATPSDSIPVRPRVQAGARPVPRVLTNGPNGPNGADRATAGASPRAVPWSHRDRPDLMEQEEALTDYLFLNPGQRLDPLERGQLIRVMVPRSTLGTFGLPVNPERAMVPVKADLVVGEDGMARAIRFIK